MSEQKQEKLTAIATPEQPRPHKSLVQEEGELTPAQLEAIAAGASDDDGCPEWKCGGNHNETMLGSAQLNIRSSTSIQPGGLTP
ncbi:MAG: hypothetical protein QNJ72_40560 [Pleurocapsa sp. MO_226.B13]|nr:hypothetical protein [Pleurocapsa sp. MO_226.B13]